MTQPDPRQQMRDLIANEVLHRWIKAAHDGEAPDLPIEGDCHRIAGWVMDLFTEVEVVRTGRSPGLVIPVANYSLPGWTQRATHTQFELRTSPQPIEEGTSRD